jgi:hypothetical protein
MEPIISNQPPKKSGRTKKTTSQETKGSVHNEPSPSPSSDAPTFVEAKKIELGTDREIMSATMDKDNYLAKFVVTKYPDKYVAWVDKEKAVQQWLGWKLLNWDTAKGTLREVTSMDEASKTHGNALCWRDINIQKSVENEWRQRQMRANDFQRKENSKTQAEKVSESFEGIKSRYNLDSDSLSVRPLGSGEQ